MVFRLLIFVFFIFDISAHAQRVELVKDINQKGPNLSSYPSNIISVGPLAFAILDDGKHGRELWKTSGTVESTLLVKDLVPGGGSALRFRSFTNANGILFFLTWTPMTIDLWKSGGNNSNTILLKQFSRSELLAPEVTEMKPFQNGVVFVLNTKQFGREPWISDGTAAGTHLLKDIIPGSNGSFPVDFTNYNGFLFFAASTPEQGHELWRSNGTESGTTLFQDIQPGPKSSGVSDFRVFNNLLYFGATDDRHGAELWRTNGTPGAARLVNDLNPGTASSNAIPRTIFNGNLILTVARSSRIYKMDPAEKFTALNANTNIQFVDNFVNTPEFLYFRASVKFSGTQLWQTDGTASGTHATTIADGSIFLNPGPMSRVNTKLLVTSFGSVWVTDGNPKTALKLPIIGEMLYPEPFGSLTLFSAFHSSAGQELWITDGSITGTHLVKDVAKGNGSSSPSEFYEAEASIYFTADSGAERFAVKSNGSGDGTERLLPQPVSHLFVLNNKLILQIGNELWTSNLDGSDRHLLKKPLKIGPIWITLGKRLIFAASVPDLFGNFTLWSTDGTSAGTIQLHPSLQIPDYPYPHPVSFTKLRDVALIQVWDSSEYALWATNGTVAGTRRVKKLDQQYPAFFDGTVYKNEFYFSFEQELWKTSGSESTSVKVQTFSEIISNIEAAGGSLAVGSFDANNHATLWWSNNGSTFNAFDMGTKRISAMTSLGNALLFNAGDELWVSSGNDSTSKIADVTLGESILIGQKLYFSGLSQNDGNELWISDGTTIGTHLVRDINLGKYGSNPEHFFLFKNRVYFSADNGKIGKELWRFSLEN